jgi:hypothetical protein
LVQISGLCALLILLSVNIAAQSPRVPGALPLLAQDHEVALAISAAPAHLRDAATVFVFGRDGYRRVRVGTNGFTCLVNRDGAQSGDRTLRPTCWDGEGSRTIVPVMLRVGTLLAQGKSAAAIRDDIDTGFRTGHFQAPTRVGIAYMLAGDVRDVDTATGAVRSLAHPPHYMIYAPGVTNADIGMTIEASRRDPTLPTVYAGYSGGSNTAYLIVLAADPKGIH